MTGYLARGTLSLFVCIFLLCGASSFASDFYRPSQFDNLQGSILEISQQVHSALVDESFGVERCLELAKMNATLGSLPGNSFTEAEAAQSAREAVSNFFKARIILREKFGVWLRESTISNDCLDTVREGFNSIRSVEDYFALLQNPVPAPGKMAPILKGETPFLLINEKFPEKDKDGRVLLKTGDVLVSRGAALVSAMIAKITAPQGLFSHGALVYIDETSGQAFTVEAKIEEGTFAKPIEAYFASANSRVAVFRYKDPKIAAAAANFMFDRAIKEGKKIRYDFEMNGEDHSELYCAEVITQAFEAATYGAVVLPTLKSRLNMHNSAYLEKLGIGVTEIFAPMDMDIEPDFDFVAEWRQAQNLGESLFYDAKLAKIYEWMDVRGYLIKPPLKIKFLKWLGWGVRKTPYLNRPLKARFPKNMSVNVIEVMLTMAKIEEALGRAMFNSREEFLTKNNRPMTQAELLIALEDARKQDAERHTIYNNWWDATFRNNDNEYPNQSGYYGQKPPARPIFHWIFSPKKMN